MTAELILLVATASPGVTALIQTLSQNRTALADAGVTFPDQAEIFLSNAATGIAKSQPDHQTLAARLATLDASRLLLCIHPDAGNPASIRHLCSRLQPHFDITACLYLQSQESLIAQSYADEILAGLHAQKFTPPTTQSAAQLDLLQIIWPWEQVLGPRNVIVRAEDAVLLASTGVAGDFLNQILRVDPASFAIVAPSTLNMAALEFRRLVNSVAPDQSGLGDLNTALAQWSEAQSAEKGTPLGFAGLLAPHDIARIREDARPANDYIAQRFQTHGKVPLFAPPVALSGTAAERATNKELRSIFEALAVQYPSLVQTILDQARLAETDNALVARVSAKRLLASSQPKADAPSTSALPKKKPAHALAGGRGDLIVHFGMHKTGTSSIQETLFHNRKALGKSQYLSFGQVNGSFGISRFFRQANANPADFHLALSKLGPNPGIISAEGLTTLGERQLDAFLRAISSNDRDATFIGYVREPVGYYTSMFQETLKTHKVDFEDLATWFRRKGSYYKWLDMLVEKVGPDRVRAFPFDRRFFPDGDVVAHFLGEIGYDVSTFDIESANESLSATAVKALYCYRKLKAPKDSDVGAKSPIGTFIQRLPSLGGPKFTISTEVQAKIAALNAYYSDWAQKSLIWPVAQPQAQKSAAAPAPQMVIAHEADLLNFSAAEISQIVAWSKTLGVAAGAHRGMPASEFVAETMHKVRLSNLTLQVVLQADRPLKKLPRWIRSIGRRLKG